MAKSGAGAHVSIELEVALSKETSKEVIDALKIVMLHSDSNPYAQTYAHGMTRSLDEFGVHGVKVQTLYLLNNLQQWKGEDARNSKKILNKWSNS